MSARDTSIRTHFIRGFIALFLFLAILGWMTYNQNQQLRSQTENILNSALSIERATGRLRYNVLLVRDSYVKLMEPDIEGSHLELLKSTEQNRKAVDENLKVISLYQKEIPVETDMLGEAVSEWNVMLDELLRLLPGKESAGNEMLIRVFENVRSQEDQLLRLIDNIDEYNFDQSTHYYQESKNLNSALHFRMLGMIAAINLILLSFYLLIWRNIKEPLTAFAKATRRFAEGDFSARNDYTSGNEFGKLSASLNSLADGIQNSIELNNRFAEFARLMLDENDSQKFFRLVIRLLLEESGAHLGMVYLYQDDKDEFVLYESIGAGLEAKESFDAGSLEGELGMAVATGKLQHIKDVNRNNRFSFYTSAGRISPAEIITIPIIEAGKTIAVFSIGHANGFNAMFLDFIKRIQDTLNARVHTILLLRRMEKFTIRLEEQNQELEVQKSELMQQSDELQEQNTELEHQKRKLKEANTFKTSFLSNMSHELRTPLNSIIALTGVLNRRLSGNIPEEEHSYLEVVERNGKHLLALINDILDLSRIETGKEELFICKIDALAVVDDVLTMSLPQARMKGIGLIKNSKSANEFIDSDAGKLRQILINLISNAIKFTVKGKVEVSVYAKDSFLNFVVSDTGIGIAEEHLDEIFDEFKQADSSTSRKYGGTGLGLAIARKYARLLGGDISVKSIQGTGSEFRLSVPRSTGKRNCDCLSHPENEMSCNQNMEYISSIGDSEENSILLVDDSMPVIIQMRDVLKDSGFKVLTAPGGEEALEMIKHTVPDAMVLDLMMPTVDGFQVLKTLREAEPTAHVPVLILTAKHITKDDLAFLKRNNVHQLIQKGDVNREELLRTIRQLVMQSSGNRKEGHAVIPGNRKRILIVEDNPDNMTTVKALLDDKYDVVEAVDGIQGVEMAKKYLPDLILMDIALPGMNGIEAFGEIRKERGLEKIPVVALTANAFSADRAEIISHGFDGYLTKPVEKEVLIELLESTLYGK